MDFNDILFKYEEGNDFANRMKKLGSLSLLKRGAEYFDGYKQANFNWFQTMKAEIGFLPESKTLEGDEAKDYKFIDEFGKEYLPYRLIFYRGEEVPVFLDDYGQQEFIVFRSRICCGGGYDSMADDYFCKFVDEVKDEIE